MRRSIAKHRLISRVSELFDGDPDLREFSEGSTDVSVLVSAQLGKAVPEPDQKSRCNVLFADKKPKQKRESSDSSTPQNFIFNSTQVIYDYI